MPGFYRVCFVEMTLGELEQGTLMVNPIYTVGHSTHPIEEFIEILLALQIQRVVDVRSIPRSCHNPQFDQVPLERSLLSHGIHYTHLKELGGLRHTSAASINTGWRNASFRGYADYMLAEEFQAGLHHLMELGQEERVVLLCAEAVPWRCHRSLIADALNARGVQVEHILDNRRSQLHRMTPWVRVDGLRITYPAASIGTEKK
jgi:uncharacterized protein (DUF488 family)